MRIIEMERRTLDGKPVEYGIDENGEDYRDWFCVIETKEEDIVYDLAFDKDNKEGKRIWNYMVIHAGIPQGLAWGEDDIYGYFTPDEVVPEVGEEWTDSDNDKWVRVE